MGEKEAADFLAKSIGKQIVKDADNLPGFGFLVATLSMYAGRLVDLKWVGGYGRNFFATLAVDILHHLLILVVAYVCWLLGDQLDEYFFKKPGTRKNDDRENVFEWKKLKDDKKKVTTDLIAGDVEKIGAYHVSTQLVKEAKPAAGRRLSAFCLFVHRLSIYLINQLGKFLRSMAIPWIIAAFWVAFNHSGIVLAVSLSLAGVAAWFVLFFIPRKPKPESELGLQFRWLFELLLRVVIAVGLQIVATVLALHANCIWGWFYGILGTIALPASLLLKRSQTHLLYRLALDLLHEYKTSGKYVSRKVVEVDKNNKEGTWRLFMLDNEIIASATLKSSQAIPAQGGPGAATPLGQSTP